MLNLVVSYYEQGHKAGIQLNEMKKFENLKGLQEAIEKQDGKRYSLGELSDCVGYIHHWNKG